MTTWTVTMMPALAMPPQVVEADEMAKDRGALVFFNDPKSGQVWPRKVVRMFAHSTWVSVEPVRVLPISAEAPKAKARRAKAKR